MKYSLVLDPRVLEDIQKAIDYYDEQKQGLGLKFEAELNAHFKSILKTPFFAVRYDQIHCLPLKKFPFMIHYEIDEVYNLIGIRAVFHTKLNPSNWYKR